MLHKYFSKQIHWGFVMEPKYVLSQLLNVPQMQSDGHACYTMLR